MDKKKAAIAGSLACEKRGDFNITSTETQAQRDHVLAMLQTGRAFSTLDFRAMGIMHPAGRIRELREQGYNIVMTFTYRVDVTGLEHRTGVYILVQGVQS